MPPPPLSLLRQIILFPLTRLLIALGFVLVVGIVASLAVDAGAGALGFERDGTPRALLAMVVIVPAIHAAYWIYVRLVERRRVRELSRFFAVRELALGTLLGAGLFTVVIGAIALFGGYRIVGTNPWTAVLPIFAVSIMAGYVEEIVARGIIFRIVEDGLGTWAALILSAVAFGALHHGNPSATWMSSLSIALTAGILLAATFVLTRRLWMAIGLHFAWNFTQGGIFGVAVSGHEVKGILQSELSGPELIAGGAFGAEASIFAILACVPVGGYLLFRGYKQRLFVSPMWRRPRGVRGPREVCYWKDRENLRYYRQVLDDARKHAPEARRVLDVGSHRTQYLSWFKWIPEKHAIDLLRQPDQEGVIGIKGDFMAYEPEKPFDLVLCLQVLEHVADPAAFCRRLFAIGRIVIISVPYRWRAGAHEQHVHDPVDEAKLDGWTGSAPLARTIVRDGEFERMVAVYAGDAQATAPALPSG